MSSAVLDFDVRLIPPGPRARYVPFVVFATALFLGVALEGCV